GRLKTDSIEVRIDPRAEWKQQFEEAWRINRDLFYDPEMHGANWPAMREKYRAFLPDLTSRADLTRVLTWMVSELSVGHHSAIGPNADGAGARTVGVVPVADESALRNRAWVENNIHKVDSATAGRVAYVYVPNTAAQGHDYFKRYFYPQSDKDAIIVDERFNG